MWDRLFTASELDLMQNEIYQSIASFYGIVETFLTFEQKIKYLIILDIIYTKIKKTSRLSIWNLTMS